MMCMKLHDVTLPSPSVSKIVKEEIGLMKPSKRLIIIVFVMASGVGLKFSSFPNMSFITDECTSRAKR